MAIGLMITEKGELVLLKQTGVEAFLDHGLFTGRGDDDHVQYILHSLAGATNDFLVASGANTYVKQTLAQTGAILEADLQHDNLQGITANEHVDHSAVSILNGNGITGGGDLTASRTLALTTLSSLWNTGGYGININDADINTKMDIGLTINQAAYDNEILAFKSSDVAHSFTNIAEADTYFTVEKTSEVEGGVRFRGFREAGYEQVMFQCFNGSVFDTSKGTVSRAGFEVWCFGSSGAGTGDVTANGNMFVVRARKGGSAKTVFIIDEDGDYHYEGGAYTFDEYNDAAACHDVARVLSGRLDNFIQYNRGALVDMGVISSGGFVSGKRMTMLKLGAIGQLYEKAQAQAKEIERLQEKIRLLEN